MPKFEVLSLELFILITKFPILDPAARYCDWDSTIQYTAAPVCTFFQIDL